MAPAKGRPRSVSKKTTVSKKRQVMEPESESESESGSEFESGSETGSESESETGSESEPESATPTSTPEPSSSKPKMQLLESDSDSSNEDDGSSSASDDEDDMLDIEKESKLLDEQLQREQDEADTELRRTIANQTSTYHLPTPEELESELDGTRLVPPSELRERINDVLNVLADFQNAREDGRSRTDYLDRLSADLSELFGYLPELVEYFLTMFNPSETLEFLEASDSPRPMVVRTNTLKTRRKDLAASLIKRGVTLDPLATWSKVGLKITASPVPVGATPEYLSGQYMLQSAASFCPCLALSPQPGGNEVVLDLSSAPGGKTSYLAQLMRNTGTIIANDLKPERQRATVANLHRLGVRNTIVCCHDGRKLGKLWKNRFTKVLLDAPCSGLGVVSRDPSVKVQRTIKDIDRCAVLQKELVLSAVDSLNARAKGGGGIMVYSTCSVSVKENEEVVDYLLKHRDVKLLDTGLDFGKPGFTRYQQKRFHPSLAKTRRFYPHVHNMDGFYVAKILKLSDARPETETKEVGTTSAVDDAEAEDSNVDVEEGEPTTAVDDSGPTKKNTKKKGENETDWAERVRNQSTKSTKHTKDNKRKGRDSDNGKGKRKNNKQNNNNNNNGGDDDERRSKKSKVARGPSAHAGTKKPKKKATNAKVTKPRRRKQTDDM